MYEINSMLLKDFYKAVHSEMLNPTMTKSVSYFTPRKSRVSRWPSVVHFGLQAFIKTWLIDEFNKNFFEKSEEEVVNEYKRVLDNTMGKDIYDINKIANLHKLGYLPIEIVGVPEGTLVPMHCPAFGITNTDPHFAWLPQALESLISAEMWYPMLTATVGHSYREIVNKWYRKTCGLSALRRRALGNFDFRGDQGVDAALKAASGWLLSFVNTATVPSIPYMEKMYNCDCTKDEVGFGAISTEHFVMCSNSAIDTETTPEYVFSDIDPRRERIFLKRLLTEVYPNNSFSCVCDSYDYDNVVDVILPTLKEELVNHNGCMLIRGDSGDCVKVVTSTVFRLWNLNLPGNHVNEKGYKVLDPHVKALYGDSITLQRAEEIFKILEENGFAASNVSLGVGSFSMHCIEEGSCYERPEGMSFLKFLWNVIIGKIKAVANLKPFTRDTFSSAIKAVYGEFTDPETGEVKKLHIFKDPKTDRETGVGFKKSQKGCCIVYTEKDGSIHYTDGHNWDEACIPENMLQPIFRDGQLLVDESLNTIRERLNNNMF